MLQRYLQEGQKRNGPDQPDRDDYCKGPRGMAEFLRDWEELWQIASNKVDKIGKSMSGEFHKHTLMARQASQSFNVA